MLKSNLCDYSDAYIPVKGTIAVPNTAVADADANNVNTQVDNAKDIDIVMPIYNLV